MKNTPSWLSTAVFYEVYPQSFLDTNGDGIGDLPGVIAKLDYIASIGCNAIWLNPCFESPFGDAGYDVSDFYQVAARYGTNDDLIRLFNEAHVRGLKVCLDLVAGHTSTEHPWFRRSAEPTRNEFSDRYIWTNSVWENAEGFSQVNGYGERDGNYVTNFFHFQPALNYGFAKPDPAKTWQLPVDHPACKANREEMKNIMRFWLDAGADGFRVDMASSLVKGDLDFAETMALWQEMRHFYDTEYPEAALIAEWSDPERAIHAGFHIDFLIHFNDPGYTTLFRSDAHRDFFGLFPNMPPSYFDKAGQGNIRPFLDHYLKHLEPTQSAGYISLPTGNHDIMRLAHGRSIDELKVALTFLFTLPGVPYIYAGDEIGLDYTAGLVTKEGGYARTGSRTPMQWEAGARNLGFSTAPAEQLYLPVNTDSGAPTVAEQETQSDSILAHVKHLLALRKDHSALGNDAAFRPLHAEPNSYPFVYERKDATGTCIIAVNPSGQPQSVTLPELKNAELLSGAGVSLTGESLAMEGVSYAIYALAG